MSDLDSTTNKDDVSTQDESFLDVDLIEVDELLNSASRLLEEVYSIRPMAASQESVLSPREDAMQQVQRFLSSIREPEEEEDVVFVEARPGNAPPASARTTAVVDLCTPTSDDAIPETRSSRRRRRTDDIVPIEFPDLNPAPNCSNYSIKTRRRQPKPEPITEETKPSVILVDSPASYEKKVTKSPPGPNGATPALTCAVCMESVLNRKPTSTSCGHIFCHGCITQAIRLTKKCPLCNCKLKLNQVHRVYF